MRSKMNTRFDVIIYLRKIRRNGAHLEANLRADRSRRGSLQLTMFPTLERVVSRSRRATHHRLITPSGKHEPRLPFHPFIVSAMKND